MNYAKLYKQYADLNEQLTSARMKYEQAAAFNTVNRTSDEICANEFALAIARKTVRKLEDEMIQLLNKIEIKETP